MEDAFGVVVSKVVVRTPIRLVRMMSDKMPRPIDRVVAIGRQMGGPDGFENPVTVSVSRKHNLTSEGRAQARRLGLKTETRFPTPKLENGHHRLKSAELAGKKSMLVNYRIRPLREGNSLKQNSSGEWIYEKPYRGIPKDRTKEVAAGAAALGAAGIGGAGYAGYRHKKKR